MKRLKFDELSLSEEIQRAIADAGYEYATPIQSEAIPFLLEGRDVIGQAQTGTGKTAAFGIPTIEMIDPSLKGVQALILCPTRELAVQVADGFKSLLKYKEGIYTTCVYGGSSIEQQIKTLKRGVQIVIGTPGRVIDLIERGDLVLKNLRFMILDEADEMLNMGFREDIERVLEETPRRKQTILFSATMAKPILALAKEYMQDPEVIKVTREALTVPNIEQFYYEVRSSSKLPLMLRLIAQHQLQLMLVFCNTKRMVDELTEELQARGYQAEAIHGDLRQQQRNHVMRKFRQGSTNMLIATDVAARGIDVSGVDAVFNYDIPLDQEAYVHRIGRTGRAGKLGKSFSFVTGQREIYQLRDIQQYTKVAITKGEIPSDEALQEGRKLSLVAEVVAQIESGKLSDYEPFVQELLATELEPQLLLAALLKLHLGAANSFESVEALPDKKSRGRERDSEKSFGKKSEYGRDRERGGRERGGRERERERGGDRKERKFKKSGDPMTRLFFNVGKNQRVSPGDILGAILGETGIKGNQVGDIDIYDQYSFVEIAPKVAQKVIEGMSRNKIKGKTVNVEVASPDK